MYCDLHTHTIFSDGTRTPEEVIDASLALGLEAVALTDHNCVAGLPRFLAAAEGKPIHAVPGVEFSTEYAGRELHILGLFLQPEDYEAVQELVSIPDVYKRRSNLALAQALTQAGMPIDYAALERATPGGRVNRAHFAAELVRQGFADTISQAFHQYLDPEQGFYHPAQRLGALETIRFLDRIGAVSVLAHPFLNLSQEALREFLPLALWEGLDAMETDYSTYDPETTAAAHRIAREFHLLPSGGSDYHGANKPNIALGTGWGNLRIPAAYYRDLAQRAAEKQQFLY